MFGGLPPRGASLKKLFPADWKLIANEEGDLDGDGVKTIGLVIKAPTSAD